MNDVVEESKVAWQSADAAWRAELERRFGASAGDVRYTDEGRSGDLALLYERFMRALLAWQLAKAECLISDLQREIATLRRKLV